MIRIDNIEPHELVCHHVYDVFGGESLKLADPRLILWLRWFRNAIDQSMFINNWSSGGSFSQRGYRCPQCSLVKDSVLKGKTYLSAHTRFQAVDFDIEGMLAEEVRQWIDRHKKDMPVSIRIEKDTTWVHVDVCTDREFDKKPYCEIIYFQG
jgi:hypothetical protein